MMSVEAARCQRLQNTRICVLNARARLTPARPSAREGCRDEVYAGTVDFTWCSASLTGEIAILPRRRPVAGADLGLISRQRDHPRLESSEHSATWSLAARLLR